jgi:hypothetical protein
MAKFQIDNIIKVAKELELLNRIDVIFADFIMKLEGYSENSKYLWLAVLFLSKSTNSKHTCLDLHNIAECGVYDLIEDEIGIPENLPNLKFPDFDIWMNKIKGCVKTVVCEQDASDVARHIVITEDGFLYLHKYWQYEQVVVEAINGRKVQRQVDNITREDLRPAFNDLQNQSISNVIEETFDVMSKVIEEINEKLQEIEKKIHSPDLAKGKFAGLENPTSRRVFAGLAKFHSVLKVLNPFLKQNPEFSLKHAFQQDLEQSSPFLDCQKY